MHRELRWAFLALVAAACGSTALDMKISSDATDAHADGQSPITVTVHVTRGGAAIASGQVDFKGDLEGCSFAPIDVSTTPDPNGCTKTADLSVGDASVRIYSSRGGAVKVTAIFKDVSSLQTTKSLSLNFGGSPEVASFEYLGATPSEVPLLGTSTVSFKAKNLNNQPVSQVAVVFTLSQNPGGASISPENTTTAADGTVNTTLTAGNVPGTVKVQIANTSGSVTKTSDSIAISGGGINAKNFTMSCTHASIGGFEADGLEMTCTVYGSDLKGAFVPNSKVIFMTEAGGVPASADFAADSTTGGGIATFTYRTQCKWPKDVTALGGSTDPARANCSFVNKCGPTGPVTEMRTCNPRDGLATLVAVTTGSEAFDDTNQNGKWDPGEGKTDLGEPFVDANDNGTHDSGTDNEDFYDTNNNGVWDGPNGVWDASTSIWTTYKILWTGGPDFNSAGAQASITPANNVTENHCVGTQYVLKILDINGNPPTATSGQDAVTVNPGGNVTVLHISGYYDGVTSPAAGEKQGLVLVDVMDAHSCPDCPGCGPEPYTLDFVLNRTLDGNSKVEEHPALGTRSGTYN